MPLREKHASAYTMPAVGSACVSTRTRAAPGATPPSSRTSHGMGGEHAGDRSSRRRVGRVAFTSGGSVARCAASRASVCARISATRAARASASSGNADARAASSASSRAASASWPSLGESCTVTRWPLSSRYLRTRPSKTGAPEATRARSSESASSKRQPPMGSRPWVHSPHALRASESPRRSEAPNSRRRNSMVFTAASMASASKPPSPPSSAGLARPSSVDKMRPSTAALAPGVALTPFRPTEKVACLRESPRPPPMTAVPRPDSRSARRSGDAGVPRSSCDMADSSKRSSCDRGSACKSQLRETYSPPPSGPAPPATAG
mmetsp:Transcript_15373/g.51886  ORF Transcript_15373/g.51886 Transcript_15373/m.51886 type:complete len:322 (-) Transcript_15373:865-1830(-)